MENVNGNDPFQSFFNDPERIKKFVDEYLQKQKENVHLERILVSNTDYITWLEKFMSIHPSFCDDEWLYFPEQLEPENLKNVSLLYHFFRGIIMYLDDSDITGDEFGYFIQIMFNGIGYKIGVQHGQGSYHYCEKREIFHNESDFIDFNEIMKKAK